MYSLFQRHDIWSSHYDYNTWTVNFIVTIYDQVITITIHGQLISLSRYMIKSLRLQYMDS